MNKQRLLFKAMILVLFLSSIVNSQWENQESGVTVGLNDVCFVDSLYGWAVGDSATIIATTNGGKTWQQQNSAIDTVILNKVFFVDKDVGYAIGDNQSVITPKGVILSTKNGGLVWEVSKSDIDFIMKDISFINADTGWVVGAAYDFPRRNAIILHTKDGGLTWQTQLETEKNQLLLAIVFLNERDGWALASDAFDNFSFTDVYRTSDGGEQWDRISTIQALVSHISMVSPDTIWTGLWSFAKSTDGGVRWNEISWSIDYILSIWDIDQLSGQEGWLTANYLQDDTVFSRILFTDDDGETWTDILEGQRPTLRALAFFGENLWVVGTSGVILHSDKLTTSVGQTPNQSPETFVLEQNFPNPFNPETTIKYQIPEKAQVTLKIYNLLGQQIRTLVDELQQAGSYAIRWDGKNNLGHAVASGIYLYQIQAGDFLQVKKMAFLK